jgi:putative membrane protein
VILDPSKQWTAALIIFFKGLFMGSADIIPGVSGGTVALITGIYERLVRALRSIDFKFIPYFFRGLIDRRYLRKAKDNFSSIDFIFLLPLVSGIAVAFFSLANVMGFLLEEYPSYTYAFFFGLILSSALLIYFTGKMKMTVMTFFFLALGVGMGYLIVGLEAIQTDHSLLIIFVSGMITFCAMILPGISGAFILLFLGQYEFMLGVLRQLTVLDGSRLSYAIVYPLGGVIGLVSFSRVLSYLLEKHRNKTLSFIVGLMVGALREPGEIMISHPGNILLLITSAVIGVILVTITSYLGRRLPSTN